MAFYCLDPWGDQREDMRMAQTMWAIIQPQTKQRVDPNDYRLFPDEANDLPDDVNDQEKAWMLKLSRSESVDGASADHEDAASEK